MTPLRSASLHRSQHLRRQRASPDKECAALPSITACMRYCLCAKDVRCWYVAFCSPKNVHLFRDANVLETCCAVPFML